MSQSADQCHYIICKKYYENGQFQECQNKGYRNVVYTFYHHAISLAQECLFKQQYSMC